MAVKKVLTTAVEAMKSRRGESKGVAFPDDKPDDEAVPPAVPAPPYRHAAPSGPWPWMDFNDLAVAPTAVTTVMTSKTDVATVTTEATTDAPNATTHDPSCEWSGYPQNLFGNWTPDQVKRSQMLIKCSKNESSKIYWMDVLDDDASFITPDMGENSHTSPVSITNDEFWGMLQGKRPGNIRVRSIFVDDLTSPVMRMLGTRYNIEPFFFTSSINWIPSRYQEAPGHGVGDHITITLPFVRTLHRAPLSAPSPTPPEPSHSQKDNAQINTQASFPMSNGDMLFIDLLAIHMVRDVETSTIISYHPESTWCRTSAKRLHQLMLLVGGSVYWQIIFSKTKDPTFLFLAILWYALYAWDESFELLYNHVSGLESDVLHESRIELTRKLHVLQAHLLHYQSLLHNFRVSVAFIEKTPNPAMESEKFNEAQRNTSKELMDRECGNLLSEIDRLERRREMLSSRLKNAMDLAFATVNIEDSKQTRELTQATVRDSAAMKQISYLTMVFLPASFVASVFGMNVREINDGSLETLAHYAETTISLTLLTVYIVVTLQPHTSFHEENAPLGQRMAWPYRFLKKWIEKTDPKSAKGKTTEKTSRKSAHENV
ncbi:hypothetical protein K503DRAFT_774540 [Rhizopogon vinicolor AM-OR11-026]|uniref:Cora-domain-containing protein n=1 Tax=Rhizopogon vinicolor AM-OR11-026 TaxID=1314800 RepID=A0A1B7MP89_9AGAM|nr:hypothetical protein K503DRAFT_774540 [Rhizopogon vinicolor AM-OR11-026]